MSKKEYCKKVLLRIIPVAVVSAIIPLMLHQLLPSSIVSSIVVVLISIGSVLLFSYLIGLEYNERLMLQKKTIEIKNRLISQE